MKKVVNFFLYSIGFTVAAIILPFMIYALFPFVFPILCLSLIPFSIVKFVVPHIKSFINNYQSNSEKIEELERQVEKLKK